MGEGLCYCSCFAPPATSVANTLLVMTKLLQGFEGGTEVCHPHRPSGGQGGGEERTLPEMDIAMRELNVYLLAPSLGRAQLEAVGRGVWCPSGLWPEQWGWG